MIRLVLLGPPGCGKGTHAERLSLEYGLVKVSTGDILRGEVNAGTELGQAVMGIMEAGELVPDSVILKLVGKKLEGIGDGYVLDGFPRTLAQAEALDKLLEERRTGLDLAVALEVPDDVIVRRLTDRRSCLKCGAVYNLTTAPPLKEGVCDSCGSGLVQRDDDREETVKERLEVYRKRTEPLNEYYAVRGILRRVDGDGRIDEVYDRVRSTIAGTA